MEANPSAVSVRVVVGRVRLTATATYRPRGDLGRYVEVHITPAGRASVEASCRLVESTAKNYAAVDTGAMRDSIDTVIDESGKTIIGTVAPHVDYAVFVEFGTRFMAAQPFMRPAIDESRGPVIDIFRQEIQLGLR